jgi:predicted nicotinamide N-methyase
LTPDFAERMAFIHANTRLRPVPLVPEIRLHLADEAVPLWQKTEEELAQDGLPPPFWAFAWAGGQALARHLLDGPERARARSVIDLGSGSGLVAIAAARAGAGRVLACDIDPFAQAAIALNAAENAAAIEVAAADPIGAGAPDAGLVLVGDLFYDREIADRLVPWLTRLAEGGAEILVGDPGRAYLPKDRLEALAVHSVPVTRELEDSTAKLTTVWRWRG